MEDLIARTLLLYYTNTSMDVKTNGVIRKYML